MGAVIELGEHHRRVFEIVRPGLDLEQAMAELGHGLEQIGVTGYPESHALISDETTIQAMFGVGPELLRDGEGWAVELVNLSTHNGTHLDAPYHFHSTQDAALGEKKPAIAIHDVPLEWCFQPGVKLEESPDKATFLITFQGITTSRTTG